MLASRAIGHAVDKVKVDINVCNDLQGGDRKGFARATRDFGGA